MDSRFVGVAEVVINSGFLEHIKRLCNEDFYERWAYSTDIEEREAIFRKKQALEELVFFIESHVRKHLGDNDGK